MPGLLGIAPLIAAAGWWGYLGASALLVSLGVLAAGCPSSQSPKKDEGSGDSGPDGKPPDIGMDGFPRLDRYIEVGSDGPIDDSYRQDVTRLDIIPPDLTLPDLTLPDLTLPDITLPDITPSGINLKAATFLGSIVDIDPAQQGLTVLIGPPTTGVSKAGVYDCQVNGLGTANCQLKADLSTQFPTASTSMPITYYQTSFGSSSVTDYGIVIGAPSGAGKPIDMFKIDLQKKAVTKKENIKDFTIKSGSTTITYYPAYPRGFAAYYDSKNKPPQKRLFVATANSPTNSIGGTIMGLADQDNPKVWVYKESMIFSPEKVGKPIPYLRGTSALAMTKITYKGSLKAVLVALNSGDVSGSLAAGISVFDPEEKDGAKMHLKTISLGIVTCAMMSELPLDSTGKIAYAVCEDSIKQKGLKAVDLETDVISNITLGTSVSGASKVTDMVVDGAKVYIADGTKRVVFVDLGGAKVKGYVSLPAAPTTLTVLSGIVYVGCDKDMVAIDPSKVTLIKTP